MLNLPCKTVDRSFRGQPDKLKLNNIINEQIYLEKKPINSEQTFYGENTSRLHGQCHHSPMKDT